MLHGPEHQTDSSSSNSISVFEKWLYVVLFAGLAVIRIPEILSKGRFWAEEGQIFFVNALTEPWYKALFLSYGGYLNITANLAGVLAHLAPLKAAPYVTSIFALIIQCFPAILLCFSGKAVQSSQSFCASSDWLKTRSALITALLVVLTLPASQEVWLSSIGSQVHLNLCVGLILVLNGGGVWYRNFQRFLLVLAPLSGPGGSFLIPLFFLRAFLDSSRERLIQALIMTVACAVQILFFWHAQERVLGCDPLLFINILFVKHLLVPFWGLPASDDFCANLKIDWMSHKISHSIVVYTIGCFALWIAILWRQRKSEPIGFFVTAVTLASLAYFGALGDKSDLLLAQPGARYAFAPQILFELSFVSMAFMSTGFIRNISRVLCAWLLVIALHEYFVTPPVFRDGPSWRSELRKWEKDPHYAPRAWPTMWFVTLDKCVK
jgi:hypothetical protein